MPARYPLSIYEGDTYGWTFALWADEAKTDPVDLTNVLAAAQVRDKPGGEQIVDLAVAVTLPNEIEVTLDAPTSAKTPTGVWDLQLTYSDGRVVTVVSGPVRVTADVTP